VRRVVDKLALISSVSRSYNSTNVIIIIITEFLSEGQAGEAWESSKKAMVFRQSAPLKREIVDIKKKI
jgi:hypothetical protein